MLPRLPRILFVLGKGGVGRSTVSAALAMALRRRGARTLVFEWTLSEAIAPWYGLAAAGIDPIEVEPGLAVANFCLEDSLRAYFVGHLGLGAFYRHVVNGRAMRRLVEAAPGIAESSTRRKPLPSVIPKPRSSGSMTNLAKLSRRSRTSMFD